jgi:hypothetical protein
VGDPAKPYPWRRYFLWPLRRAIKKIQNRPKKPT